MHTIEGDDFEWDPAKAEQNVRKHGVRFADAALSMQDEFGWSIPDADSLDEFRFVFLGVDPSGRLLVTVYAFRSAKVRIISSRVASLAEARVYRERA